MAVSFASDLVWLAERLFLMMRNTSPLFFAGIIFACSFRKSPGPDYAFGSNILGAVVGGVMEYLSLVTGFHFLFIVIFILYALSYAAFRTRYH